MFARKTVRRVIAMAAGSLLFAQLALAAEACLVPPRAEPAGTSVDAGAMDDCGAAAVGRNTCLAHCLKADQPASFALDEHLQALPPSIAVVGRVAELQLADCPAIPIQVLGSRPGPPLEILFCTFQI